VKRDLRILLPVLQEGELVHDSERHQYGNCFTVVQRTKLKSDHVLFLPFAEGDVG
jgi:hypothetical protein